MGYWIFKCNPEKYAIDERLRNPDPVITWRVTRHKDEVQVNDIAFIWRTGPKRGICAVLRIDSAPKDMPEIDGETRYFKQMVGVLPRVKAHITLRGFDSISHRELKGIHGLQTLSIFDPKVYQQATNFPVTDEEGKILLRLLQERQERM